MNRKIALLATLLFVHSYDARAVDSLHTISLDIACADATSDANRTSLKSVINDGRPSRCAQMDQRQTHIRVDGMKISYVRMSDGYVLNIVIDPLRRADLHRFMQRNMGNTMLLSSHGAVIAEGMIGAAPDNGLVSIYAPDQASAKALQDVIESSQTASKSF